MKTHVTFSLNTKVVEEFNLEVEQGARSELLEALIIKFLVDYSRKR